MNSIGVYQQVLSKLTVELSFCSSLHRVQVILKAYMSSRTS